MPAAATNSSDLLHDLEGPVAVLIWKQSATDRERHFRVLAVVVLFQLLECCCAQKGLPAYLALQATQTGYELMIPQECFC